MPAVAVKQGRLVLFIFIRFKGYLDSLSSLKKERIRLEFYGGGRSTTRGEMKFFNTCRTGCGENNPLCKELTLRDEGLDIE